MVIPN